MLNSTTRDISFARLCRVIYTVTLCWKYLPSAGQTTAELQYSVYKQTLNFHTRVVVKPFSRNYSRSGYSRLSRYTKVNSWELLWQKFYRLDALPITQPTSKDWRMTVFLTKDSMLPPCCHEEQEHCCGSIFTGRTLFLSPNQQQQSTECDNLSAHNIQGGHSLGEKNSRTF